MSQRPNTQPDQNREQKRAQFAAPAASKKNKAIPILIVGLIGVGGYLVATNLGGQQAPTTVSVAAPPAPEEGRSSKERASEARASSHVLVPLSEVSSGKAKFFQYTASDKTPVRFFVIKSSDGVYRAALDACDVCYRGKQGYEQSGDDMVCRKCGRHFPSALVNEVTGGCNPIAVTRTVAGDKLLIKAGDLDSLKSYF